MDIFQSYTHTCIWCIFASPRAPQPHTLAFMRVCGTFASPQVIHISPRLLDFLKIHILCILFLTYVEDNAFGQNAVNPFSPCVVFLACLYQPVLLQVTD